MPASDDAPASPSGADGAAASGSAQARALARKAERAFNENVEKLRGQSREAREAANEQLEHARTYVVERVQERPFTTTLAVLGAGFLIGFLFAGRRK